MVKDGLEIPKPDRVEVLPEVLCSDNDDSVLHTAHLVGTIPLGQGDQRDGSKSAHFHSWTSAKRNDLLALPIG